MTSEIILSFSEKLVVFLILVRTLWRRQHAHLQYFVSNFILSRDAAPVNVGVATFEVLTAVLLMIQVSWDVTLCHWAYSSQGSEGLYCCHLQILQELHAHRHSGTL